MARDGLSVVEWCMTAEALIFRQRWFVGFYENLGIAHHSITHHDISPDLGEIGADLRQCRRCPAQCGRGEWVHKRNPAIAVAAAGALATVRGRSWAQSGADARSP
jgi:hypothetical protein